MSEPSTTLVVISIDTEEDNWVPARDGVTVENIREMPKLHRFLTSHGVRPTYFTSHPVVATPWAGDVMRSIAETGNAEIGGHLHPWNTPPLDEAFVPQHTMLKNLPPDLQLEKLRVLTATLTQTVGTPPTSFRAGRWGLGIETVPHLAECGYRIDSSVMPFINWSPVDSGANYDGAPCEVYGLGSEDLRRPDPSSAIMELPVSSGFNRLPFTKWHHFYQRLTHPSVRMFKLGGIARQLGLVKKIQLSPETESLEDMVTLSKRVVESGLGFLHVFFHSPSLTAGLNPYGATPQMVADLYQKLGSYIDAIGRFTNAKFATVTEAVDAFSSTAPEPVDQIRAPATRG